jgi:hypothetical protein
VKVEAFPDNRHRTTPPQSTAIQFHLSRSIAGYLTLVSHVAEKPPYDLRGKQDFATSPHHYSSHTGIDLEASNNVSAEPEHLS